MINVNQQALLELLKASLFGVEPSFPDGADWEAVLKEAKDQTVAALAASAVPPQETGKWQIPVAQNKVRFLQILNEQTKLVQLFAGADIPLVILKGCAAAMYYSVPLYRAMGDIDFIVPPERFDEAVALMEENGYAYTKECARHSEYRKNGVILELHKRYSDLGWDIEPLILDGLSKAVMREIYGKQFPTLPTEINGLVLLDHIRMHLYNGIGIRQIIDWMMYVHSCLNDDTVWEERFAPLVRAAGLETFALTVTKMCKRWFGLPDHITWCDNADDETARQLLEMVFDFGNFGRKEKKEDRQMEGFMMEVSRSGLFHYLQSTGEVTWKAYQKHHFLRPFAWIYQAFRIGKHGIVALFRGERSKLQTDHAKEMVEFHKKLGINYYQSDREES